MFKASIDIGSNSILLIIASVVDGKIEEIIKDISQVTQLGKNLESGNFNTKSMDESYRVLKEYYNEIKNWDLTPEDTTVTATEASRVAKNSREFFDKIKNDFGFNVQIITPYAEAYYTSMGVCSDPIFEGQESLTILDIGGASSELIRAKVNPYKLEKSISMPVGSVRAADWIENDTFQEQLEKIFNDFETEDFKGKTVVCVAGTMTAFAGMIAGLSSYESGLIDGQNISCKQFSDFLDKVSGMDKDQLLKNYPFLGKRVNTIIPGARLARAIGLHMKFDNFQICTKGLRHGTIIVDNVEEGFVNS